MKFLLHTLALLQGYNDTSPGIHYALAQRHNVVEKIVVGLIVLRNIGRSLEHLSHGLQIFFEMLPDCVGYVSETLKDGRLELIAERGVLHLCKQLHSDHGACRVYPYPQITE